MQSNTEITILREMLAADGGLVSGAKLARTLGLSRVAVWMQLQKLTRHGFTFEAERTRGYRLTGTPEQLHAGLITAHLARRPQTPEIVCLNTTDSTNSEANRRLAAGAKAPLVVLARQQTKGRGRLGRTWHSAGTGNIYASFVFNPEISPARLHDFTLWMGLSICELVENFCRLSPGLKWPNDILLHGRKAGGMLTEARVDADLVHDLIFGLGLNVNTNSADYPESIRARATSLSEAAGVMIDINKFAAALIGRVLATYDEFRSGQHRARFNTLWQRYDILRSRQISVIQGERTILGVAEGIDELGSLIVRVPGGRTERFHAGEVTLGKDATS